MYSIQCTVYNIKLTTNTTDKSFSLKLFRPITHLVTKYNVQCSVPCMPSNFYCTVYSHFSITQHWSRPNSRQALSHQLKKRGLQGVRDICKTEKVSYHDFMNNPWCPSDRSGTKYSVGDVFELLSISEPRCDVSQSLQTFQITEELVKSWFPLDMDFFKVHQLF